MKMTRRQLRRLIETDEYDDSPVGPERYVTEEDFIFKVEELELKIASLVDELADIRRELVSDYPAHD